ncbi:alpha-glucan family phosphorylase [Gynuella sunshinyii]|uniref:glycogen phosphorylase n=1 Tax=Gynuella sunshinyii YC6258 TaxID=1445510 RepID=A0A0C5VY80_9GAMM|nr:alpha-glucan family phosphorylase [Gynuella sunshinyii]AJQ95334.1 glucan phosphorylase [Gynuella sunshinyii YC6258]
MSDLPNVAYFCMEYALRYDIKTYSGGLGVLAGDYVKGVKDNNYPLIAIGIKWKYGYVTQTVDKNGLLMDSFPVADYSMLEDTGVKFPITIENKQVMIKAWKVKPEVGVKELILLDTDLPENEEPLITDRLYGGDHVQRVRQEMVLGIGGIKYLRAINADIQTYHFNEGHAILAGIELLREQMEDHGLDFNQAHEAVKKQIVFTTHTPVKAGNEEHDLSYLTGLGANQHLSEAEMVEIGGSPFNMTVAALRLSRLSNAVAQLHGETANIMWKDVGSRSEIIAITNGIHHGTWVDDAIYQNRQNPKLLWKRHCQLKNELIEFIKERNDVTLDANKLLIGFARRAAPYKRSNLIYSSGEKLRQLLQNGTYQIVFAGKAHPADDYGKAIIRDLIALSKEFPDSVVFMENYDMQVGAMLTRGCDIWLNNPRRPMEACGTSGMKAAMNGVPNVSILDGWWPEACNHGVNGWAIGDDKVPTSKDEQDVRDAKFLSTVLSEEVIPTYYEDRDRWISIMQASINDCYEAFSVDTMLSNYYSRLY